MGHTEIHRVIPCEASLEGERCAVPSSYIVAVEDDYGHLYEQALCERHKRLWELSWERYPPHLPDRRYRYNWRLV